MSGARSTKRDARARGCWQGMNWCRPSTRLAIYLRDGLACVWCGSEVEAGTVLTLDHLRPHSDGGDNRPTNLVTACKPCNDSRGARNVGEFARVVAAYRGVSSDDVAHRARTAAQRSLRPHRLEALSMLTRRGTVRAVLASGWLQRRAS